MVAMPVNFSKVGLVSLFSFKQLAGGFVFPERTEPTEGPQYGKIAFFPLMEKKKRVTVLPHSPGRQSVPMNRHSKDYGHCSVFAAVISQDLKCMWLNCHRFTLHYFQGNI